LITFNKKTIYEKLIYFIITFYKYIFIKLIIKIGFYFIITIGHISIEIKKTILLIIDLLYIIGS